MSANLVVAMAAGSATLAALGIRRMSGRGLPGAGLPLQSGVLRGRGPLARRAWGRRLAARLARAGIPLGPDVFVFAVASAAVAAAAIAFVALRLPVAAVVAAGAVTIAAIAVVRSADRRHLARIEAQLPGVAQQLSAALAAGLSLRQALARAARDAPDPARDELSRTVAELDLGTRPEAALEGLAERVPVHDLRIMVTAILVQRRTGGNLSRALAALSGRLEERAQLARELQGATAQARMTAWLVAALPVGGGLMAEVAAPGTLARTLGQAPGPALLAVAGVLYGAGVVAIRRIGRIEA